MTHYLLDTNIWIYVMRGRPAEVRERFAKLKPGAVILSPIVLGELDVGWRKSERPQANEAVLAQYVELATLVPLDDEVAHRYGEIRTTLELAGTPIGENDLWIAAQAIEANAVLVTNNVREFSRVPGLRVEDWVQPPAAKP